MPTVYFIPAWQTYPSFLIITFAMIFLNHSYNPGSKRCFLLFYHSCLFSRGLGKAACSFLFLGYFYFPSSLAVASEALFCGSFCASFVPRSVHSNEREWE